MEFCVLASGSDGNASFVRYGGFGVLIDLGLQPRRFASALRKVGLRWDDVNAVLLTHAHGDHWCDVCAMELHARQIPIYCHPRHIQELSTPESAFEALEQAGLVRTYELDQPWALTDSLRCQAFFLPHDGGINCGFRLEATHLESGLSTALGYASDLGTWNEGLVNRLRNVDILALEFNHDETMQRESGRPTFLINRVMGSRGHLSNRQAADFLKRLLTRSQAGRLAHLVQLHLSRQCNTPSLAAQSARAVIEEMRRGVKVHTVSATHPPVCIHIETAYATTVPEFKQSFLPGWDAGMD